MGLHTKLASDINEVDVIIAGGTLALTIDQPSMLTLHY